MRVLVVGAAPVEGSKDILTALSHECDMVIAADAAGEWCIGCGVQPDLVVGDFDSSSEGAIDRLAGLGVDVRVFPAHKDLSDLDLAIEAARAAGAREVVLTACLAGRLDHTVAVLGTISQAADLCAEAHEPQVDVWAVSRESGTRVLAIPVGTTVSVFATGTASGVSLTGFQYPLLDAALGPLSSHGLSNRILEATASVTVGDGAVLVMWARDENEGTPVLPS